MSNEVLNYEQQAASYEERAGLAMVACQGVSEKRLAKLIMDGGLRCLLAAVDELASTAQALHERDQREGREAESSGQLAIVLAELRSRSGGTP